MEAKNKRKEKKRRKAERNGQAVKYLSCFCYFSHNALAWARHRREQTIA
jgi:hypothetical protein